MGATWSSWAQREEKGLKEQIKTLARRPNVLVVGRPGAGKSSLINALETCLTHDYYTEVSAAGEFASGSSMTFHLRRFGMLEYNEDETLNKIKSKFPVIFDMPGLQNVDDERVSTILQCVVEGKVAPDDTVLNKAVTPEDIKNCFSKLKDYNKIDRIIFVHACTEEVPEHLAEAVKRISQHSDVAVFGVLTKIDRKDRRVKKEDLDGVIGTTGTHRCYEVELYHSGRLSYGKYEDNHQTNYYLYLLLRGIINQRFRIHSTQQESAS